MAKALWVREEAGRPITETIVDALQDQSVLVVLDNCEQVIGAAASLSETVMRRCPRVTLIATSREPLDIGGEHVYRVPSLSVPDPGEAAPGAAVRSEAVRLFIERAGQQKPGFSLHEDNAAIIGQLCRRLDGIPFAIEPAAARLRSMSVRDLDVHLDQRFRLLTGGSRTALPRQHTLQALIDWSYDLLSTSEQAMLARLSVFAGGFDMAAAEAVCTGGDVDEFEVLELLDALVDKSLVQADDSAGTDRYRLLETMRDYGAAKLAERGEGERREAARAHRDYFLTLANDAAPHLRGQCEVEWADRLEVELDNLRIALTECLSDPDPNPGLKLGVAVSEFWYLRGHGVEGAEVLRALLERPEAATRTRLRGLALAAASQLTQDYIGDYPAAIVMAEEALSIARAEHDDALSVKALTVLSGARNLQCDHRGCLSIIDEALPIARQLDDPTPSAYLLNSRGWALDELGEDARASFEEAANLYRHAGDRRGVAIAVGNIGFIALKEGDLEAARDLTREALAVFRELGDRRGLATGALNAGYVAYLDGDDSAGRRLFTESLDIARHIGGRRLVADAILGLAGTARHTGDAPRAAMLHGVFDAIFEQLGAAVETVEANMRDADRARLRALLGDGPFDAAYTAGRALRLEDALTLAAQSASVDLPGVAP